MTAIARAVALVTAVAVVAVLIVSRAAAQGPATPDTVEAQEAAELKLIESVCGSCHTTGSILERHRTAAAWEEILVWMFDEGAVLTDDEFDRLLQFLGVQYGLVAINTAPAGDVQTVLELTDDQTRRVMSARADGRTFRTVTDLAAVIGADPASPLQARAPRIDFAPE